VATLKSDHIPRAAAEIDERRCVPWKPAGQRAALMTVTMMPLTITNSPDAMNTAE
jgi:hypothetical protein